MSNLERKLSRRNFLEMIGAGTTAVILGCALPHSDPTPPPETSIPDSSPIPPAPPKTPIPETTPALIPTSKQKVSIPELSPTSPKSLTPPKPESTPEQPKGQLWTKEVWAPSSEGPNYFFDNWNVYYFTSKDQMQVVNLKTGNLVWPWMETNISRFKFFTDPNDPYIYCYNPAYEFLGGQMFFKRGAQDGSVIRQRYESFKPQDVKTEIQFTVTNLGLNFLFPVQGSTSYRSALIDKKETHEIWRGEGRIWYTNKNFGIIIVQSKAEKVWKTIDVKTGRSTTLSRDVPNEYTVDTTSVDETAFFATITETKQVIENFRGEKVMFTRREGFVLAIDIKSGKEIWRIPDEKLPGFKSIARFRGQSPDRIYLLFTPTSTTSLTTLTQLVAIDKKTGKDIWRTNTSDINERDIYGESNNLIVLPDHESKGILVIDGTSGKSWKKPDFQIDKFLGTLGDFVVVAKGEKSGGIFAFYKNDGEPAWQIKQTDYPFAGPGPLVTEDKIVFVNPNTKKVNILGIDGKMQGEISIPGQAQDIKIPLPGYVLVQSIDNRKPQLTLVKI
ncbi:MAG: hypothetical protein A3A77_02995 [Candidatus Blackburnbacteria bacterium RIFCSPLOWO2_01_FULL_40_20]|uniref:Pyrrolo-quinoline quinone repeat domain-containing protein n=1 Tax=Candidatus Blackburnbacteria bacterium RIFCSPLOWO2_01_FULL_40_20 TaxID=1797519 RepID=A0A1G1VC09_9BACT|nr:MAG: hypothetical protein A3A77_02995 [Candidatus Blackburnbacteria bacterium RIFCSPLOWO2_01_FULL_40_20]